MQMPEFNLAPMTVFDRNVACDALGVDEITVFVVDRDRAVAQAIARRLDAEDALTVVGHAHDLDFLATSVVRCKPDVVLLDERVANGQLADIAGRVMAPDVQAALVITATGESVQRAYEAVRAGATAFVTKSLGFDDMVRVIRGATRGESWMPPRLLHGVLSSMRTQPASFGDERVDRLTNREREVLRCMMLGFDRARIASELIVSINTVRTHTQNILSKLEVHSSVEAVSVALQVGLPVAPARR